MRQNNFHYNRIKNDSSQSGKLMQQLYKVNADLEQKRKLLERKKIQEQNLKAEFYEEPKKRNLSKEYISDEKDNFFAKFERPKNQQILKHQKYKKQLDQQIMTKKQSANERNRNQILADDIFNQLLSNKPSQIPTKERQNFPNQFPKKKNQQRQRRIEPREQVPIKKIASPPHNQINYFIKTSEQQQKQRKRQQIKQYQDALQKQMQLQNLKKKQRKNQKQLYSHNNIDFNVDIKNRKNPPPLQFEIKQQKKVTVTQTKQPEKESISQKDMQLKANFNKYKKGLIDLQEFQSTKRKIQIFYGKSNSSTTKQVIKTTQIQIKQNVEIPSQQQIGKKNYSAEITTQNQSKNPNNSNQNIRGPSLVINSSNATSQYIPNYPIPQSNLGQTQQYNDFMQQQLNFTNTQMNPNQLAFQLQFMKKMFQEMKELLKTNMLTQHQRLQETLMRAGTMPQFNYIPPTNQPLYQFPPQYQLQPYNNFPNSQRIIGTPLVQTPMPIIQEMIPNRNKSNFEQQSKQKVFGEQSLQVQNMKIPYITTERQIFFKKKYKISEFKQFEYTEDYHRENLQIPSTSCYYSAPDGQKKLKKLFDIDLAHYKKLQIQKEVQLIKQKRKSQDTKKSIAEKNIKQKTQSVKNEAFKKKIIPNKEMKIVQEEQLKIQPNLKKKSYHQRQFAESLQEANNNNHLMKPPLIKNEELKEIRKALFTNPLVFTKPDQMLPKVSNYQTNQKSPISYNQQIKITASNQSENQVQSYYQQSAQMKSNNRRQFGNREIQKQLTVQSIEEDDKLFKKQSNVLKVSRNRYKQTKKIKQNVLINYKPLERKQEVKQIQNYKVYSDNQIQQDIPQDNNQDQMPHQQSQTLESKFQESVQKVIPAALPPKSKKNFEQESEVSKPPSNFTSLKQARQKAKQVKTKQKKQSHISIEIIEELQKGINKKKQSKLIQKQQIKQKKQQQKPPVANSKQLLSMLDDMVQENNQNEEDNEGLSEYYPNDFESYHTKSKNYRSNYKLNL